jgi:hypothetical protein
MGQQQEQQRALPETVDTHGRPVPYSKQRRQVPPTTHHPKQIPPAPAAQHGLRSTATSQLGALLSTGLAHGAASHTRVPSKTSRLYDFPFSKTPQWGKRFLKTVFEIGF